MNANGNFNKNKHKTNRFRWNLRTCIILRNIIFVGCVIGLLIPLRPQESALEKRTLAKFPNFDMNAIWTGAYFNNISSWYADTFPFRETLLTAGSAMKSIYGIQTVEVHGDISQKGDEIPETDASKAEKAVTPNPMPTLVATPEVIRSATKTPTPTPTSTPTPEPTAEPTPDGTIHIAPEVAGTIIVSENKGFSLYYFDLDASDQYASMLNTVSDMLGSDVNIYDIMVPISSSICLDSNIQESLGASNSKEAFDYINSLLNPSIQQVHTFDTLLAHNGEYLYYNTDHHWTSLGAYYSYVEFCNTKGLTPHQLTDFQVLTLDGFLGTFYAASEQSEALASNPDTVYAYIPNGTNDATIDDGDNLPYASHVVIDMSNSEPGEKYYAFLGGDQTFMEIHNPQINDESSCVLIKESYGNAFAPFLVDHYQNTYIVDYRKYPWNLADFIREKGIDDVIFLNNAQAINADRVGEMKAIFGLG